MPHATKTGLDDKFLAEMTFTILDSLHCGPENFLHEIQGRISVRGTDDEKEEPAGEVRAWLVQFNQAQAHGINSRTLGDDYFQEISGYWQELFDPDGNGFKVEIQDGWQTEGSDLLIIGLVHIPLRLEASGIGLAALGRTIDLFGPSCDLVACSPEVTKDYADHELDCFPETPMRGSNLRTAITKLRGYCLKSGFRRWAETDIYLLNPAHERSDLLLE
jgi:hypothetical protein